MHYFNIRGMRMCVRIGKWVFSDCPPRSLPGKSHASMYVCVHVLSLCVFSVRVCVRVCMCVCQLYNKVCIHI